MNEYKIIAHINNDFKTKFGVPRQSGICKSIISKIVFEPEYRVREAFRGIEQYSHLWILWQFSEAVDKEWTPTVRPPKLGGNKRMGVFATRSPFRPNNIGLSSVKLEKVEFDNEFGPILYVSGADLMNNTPIIDVKPYLPYTDIHKEATSGFSVNNNENPLTVEFEESAENQLTDIKKQELAEILSADPRPGYQEDNRIYKMEYGNLEVHFQIKNNTVTVCNILNLVKQKDC